MTFKDTLIVLGFALFGVMLILADMMGTFLFWTFGQLLVEISPWTLVVYLPFVLAFVVGSVIGLVWVANRMEDRIGDGSKQPEPVVWDDDETKENIYVD